MSPKIPVRFGAALAVFAAFAAASFVQSPVPGVNEPHYLAKAKHYWNPEFGQGDFFLESSDAHLVFFQTVGLFTRWLALEQTAFIGRLLALALLAGGWTRLISRLVPGTWTPLFAAAVFLAMAAVGNFSGEWIIGGVEAKIFSYGFVFWGLAFLLDDSRNGRPCQANVTLAAACGGLAVSFHPVVGLWSIIAAAFAGIVMWRSGAPRLETAEWFSAERLLVRFAVPAGLLILCAVPGLVPALQLLEDKSPSTDFAANYIQVFFRLKHHLDPMEFNPASYAAYTVLGVLSLVGLQRSTQGWSGRLFRWFCVGATGIALAGLLIGAGPRPPEEMPFFEFRMKLLKFYPFRLFDVMVPVAVSVVCAGGLQTWLDRRHTRRGWTSPSLLVGTLCGGLLAFGLIYPGNDRNPSRMTDRQLSDWIAACRWIDANAPQDSLFLTPMESWAFKWYAQRPEFVVPKDCPQDAPGIVEWNRRLRFLREWFEENYDGGYSHTALHDLHEQTGITHIVSRRLGPFDAEEVYQNETYRIYRIRSAH